MNNTPTHILISSGTSGGHLLPALATAEYLSSKGYGIHFLIAPRSTWKVPDELQGYACHHLLHAPLPRGLTLQWVLFPFKFIWNFFLILKLLIDLKPRLSIGFGSFVSLQAVSLAKLLGCKTLIHEQNAVFGLANRLLKLVADKTALTFPVAGCPEGERFHLTGYPLCKELAQTAQKMLYQKPLQSDKLNILVVGGSQGASSLNQTVLTMWNQFSDSELTQYSVCHLAGKSDFESVNAAYEKLPAALERSVEAFSSEMVSEYQRAHLVIGRAGAGTLSELMAMARPSILIPYPFAESHQLENARILEAEGGCEVIEQKDLDAEMLGKRLKYFKGHPEALQSLADKAQKKSMLNAADRLGELSESMINHRAGEVSKL